ncbi:MAG: FliM/FliN family flagellar motor switch protein [Verrucomicrobia bacterium]|jgi:flagellar motor switch/type III secretory pathway protein FliN|nr:FliM/FliN family flagellar motor switch protein [Verrucomicrobiota bacterium]
MIDDPYEEHDDNDIMVSSNPESLDKLSLDKVPLKVHLEVARFQVSLDKLQKLKVGQKLPVDMDPHLVHLTINGKAIGRGEIVEIGDLVGVKILEMYE